MSKGTEAWKYFLCFEKQQADQIVPRDKSIVYMGEWLDMRLETDEMKWWRAGLIMGHTKECGLGTSLVVQWLRIRLPMQGTRVRALVQEDPTCRGATKPVHHN